MLQKWNNARDEYSFKTHFIGAIISVIATVFMMIKYYSPDPDLRLQWISFIVFGFSMIALYSCSARYHYSNKDAATVLHLRKIDHSMIYVLIAGTYTPIVLNGMKAPNSYIFLSVIWAIAIIGIIVKVCWINAPRWLYTSIYILLGWAIIFDIKDLAAMPTPTIVFLAIGGVSYTTGAVMYILKKPNIIKRFGFHEIFHVFIMFGTLFHFMAVLSLAK